MPKNEGALGAGDQEMTAAARMHGEPLVKLNRLTRFYVISAFVTLSLIPATVLIGVFNVLPLGITALDTVYLGANLLTASMLFFAGGMGIKFLPSSMGGNPHVYSLNMALWSYWFILFGTVLGILFPLTDNFLPGNAGFWTRVTGGLYGLSTLAGAMLLLVNLSKTMEKRV